MDAPRASAQDQGLQRLAKSICQTGWREPALLLLSAASPVSFVGRQLLLLTQPLWGAGPWRRYAAILQQPAAWDELAMLLSQESSR